MTAVTDLVEVVDRLLAPDGGCVWNRAQTHASLARYAVEESYELVDAIDSGDDDDLREELGDVLYQVVLHAGLAAVQGRFDLEDVAAGARDKMVRRHPHVFGAERADTEAEVVRVWRAAKSAEKASRTSVLDGVPRAMPPLERAVKLLERLEERGDAATVVAAAVRASGREIGKTGGSADVGTVRSAGANAVDERWGARMLAEVAAAREAGVDVVASLRAAVTRLEAEARVGE